MSNSDGWSDERTAAAVKDWNEGHTAQAIADKLGGVTRSAVIGKMFRLGLGRKQTTASPAQRKQRKQAATKFNFATNAKKAAPKPLERDPYVHRETIVTPPEQRVIFEALEPFDKRCRYPHGDQPPFKFCGAKAVPGQPWCPTHFKACAPAMAAKHEAAQLSGNSGQLEQPGNPREFEPLQKVQELEGAA